MDAEWPLSAAGLGVLVRLATAPSSLAGRDRPSQVGPGALAWVGTMARDPRGLHGRIGPAMASVAPRPPVNDRGHLLKTERANGQAAGFRHWGDRLDS